MPVPRAAVDFNGSRTSTLADPLSCSPPPSRSAVIRQQYFISFCKGQRQRTLLWHPFYGGSRRITGVDDLRPAERLHWLFSFPLVRLQNDRLRADTLVASVGALSTVGLCWTSYSAQRAGFGVAFSPMCPKSCFGFTAWPETEVGQWGAALPTGRPSSQGSSTAALHVQGQWCWERWICPGFSGCTRVSCSHQSPRDVGGSLVILPFILYLGTPMLAQFLYQVDGESPCFVNSCWALRGRRGKKALPSMEICWHLSSAPFHLPFFPTPCQAPSSILPSPGNRGGKARWR